MNYMVKREGPVRVKNADTVTLKWVCEAVELLESCCAAFVSRHAVKRSASFIKQIMRQVRHLKWGFKWILDFNNVFLHP